MPSNTNTIINPSNSKSGLISWITQYDSLVIFSMFSIAIITTIIFTGIFHAGPVVRTNLLFNAIGGIILAIVFIWLIFRFMGSNIVIFGKSFDVGMVVYIFIVCFVIFVLGN
jgi:hypothetical protein